MTADEKQRRTNARKILKKAITYGKVKREPCETCGDPTTDGHHDDYDQPLKVRWLCHAHHVELHRTRPPKSPARPRLVTDPALTAALRRMSATIRRQQATLRTNEGERNRLVREAIAQGWTHTQIAEATGLTRGRIGQIASGR